MSLGTDGVSQAYTYYRNPENTGNLSWVRFDGNWYYQYDQAGNTIVKAKALVSNAGVETPNTSLEYWNYGWDLNNRLTEVKKNGQPLVSYLYDAENFRVQRSGSDGTTIYTYGRDGALTYQKNLTTGLERSFTYLNDTLIGWTETKAGIATRFYVTTDQLGSVTQVLSADAANPQVLWQSEYTAFGTMAGAEGSATFDGMYTGKDIDPDTGLTYHWNRWRSEDGSRFWSEDPARDGSNWYAYAGNSPLGSTDPTGLYESPYIGPYSSSYYSGLNSVYSSAESYFTGSSNIGPTFESGWMTSSFNSASLNSSALAGGSGTDYLSKANSNFYDTFSYRFDRIGAAYENGGLFAAVGEFLDMRSPQDVLNFAEDTAVAVGLAAGSAAIERMVASPTWWNGLKNLFQGGGGGQTSGASTMPTKFNDVLKTIRDTGKAPDGFKGGQVFKNKEGVLPSADKAGNPITYKEWDVNPLQKTVDRGTERIVTGSDGRAYYTTDHYKTFNPLD